MQRSDFAEKQQNLALGSSIEGHEILSFGCAIDAGAHLGSFCESGVGFRRAEVQNGASMNAPES